MKSAHWLSVVGESALGQEFTLPVVAGIQNKANFPTNLVSLMAFEQWVARLHFCLEDKWIKKKKRCFYTYAYMYT